MTGIFALRKPERKGERMTLPEAHKYFRQFFPEKKLNDFLDPALTLLSKAPKIDLRKFDGFLHENPEVTYDAELGKAVLFEETNTLYFPNVFKSTVYPEKVKELAVMLQDIAAKMEYLGNDTAS